MRPGIALPRLALCAAGVAAGARLAIFLSVALGRLTFPFEVETLEGLTLDYAWTLWHGGNIYAPPSAHFAPNWYPPLHYLVSLPAFLLLGFSLPVARGVSIASVALVLVLGAGLLRRAGSSWSGVLLFVAAALAFYPATGYWYDVARVDATATLLAVAGVVCLAGERPGSAVAAGVLLALSVFGKQTNVATAAGALLWLALERDWPRLRRVVAALAATALPLLALALLAFGRNALVVVTQPGGHYFSLRWAWVFLAFAWPLVPLGALALLARRHADPPRRRLLGLLLVTGSCAAAMGWLTLCKIGGQPNSTMPAIFLVALAVGLSVDTLLAHPRWRGLVPGAALLLVALPPWDYLRQIPSPADRQEAREILDDMRALDGPFLAYNASFVSTLMRGEMYPYWDRLFDWAGGQNQDSAFRPDPARYPRELLDMIRGRRFRAVYTNAGDYLRDPVFVAIEESYRPARAWESGLRPGLQDLRWRHCVPRLKWLPREP